jgi:hypothetical protein
MQLELVSPSFGPQYLEKRSSNGTTRTCFPRRSFQTSSCKFYRVATPLKQIPLCAGVLLHFPFQSNSCPSNIPRSIISRRGVSSNDVWKIASRNGGEPKGLYTRGTCQVEIQSTKARHLGQAQYIPSWRTRAV